MKVAFCSSEVFPFAKTGGLADVSGALPGALAGQGCQVKVFMPLYKGIRPGRVFDDYGYTKDKGVEFYFIKNDSYFLRQHLYTAADGDYPDNLERFSFYCDKVLSLLENMNWQPDIIHSNDWQASLVNIYLAVRKDGFFKRAKSILTIHNLAFQGVFPKEKYGLLGIDRKYFSTEYLEYYGKINLLKGGIVFSDVVNTVSPTYAEQIQTDEFGCGLDGVLRMRRENLYGILNAIDYKVWNPEADKLIYKKYSPGNIEDKYINKGSFQKDLGLKAGRDKFLLGMVSRLAEQKGIDILSESLPSLLKKYQLVILGLGDEKYHNILRGQAGRHKKDFSLNLKFDEKLAHRIYACCDAFLMPSRFEPCGLSQLISFKYATVPIVNSTGGLVDTVIDVKKGGGGFVFNSYTKKGLVGAVDRAYSLFQKKKDWRNLLKKICGYNFSWKETARKYVEMYRKVTKR